MQYHYCKHYITWHHIVVIFAEWQLLNVKYSRTGKRKC